MYFAARKLCKKLGKEWVSEEDRLCVEIAGLCHDLGKGRVKKMKKIMENSIMGLDPPSPLFMEKNKVFFSETRPFFEHFL